MQELFPNINKKLMKLLPYKALLVKMKHSSKWGKKQIYMDVMDLLLLLYYLLIMPY